MCGGPLFLTVFSLVFMTLSLCALSTCLYTDPEDCFTPGVCYYGMLVPIMFPVTAAVLYCNRVGLKFFIHN